MAMDDGCLDLVALRTSRHEATQALLGDTIGITDDQWNQPSRLPGWTRAHVATHLARNADGLVRVIDQVKAGKPTRMYQSASANRWAIESGSRRSALELQVDLDASAGRLHERFAELTDVPTHRQVSLKPGLRVRLDHLPLVRLNELVLHRIDLDVDFECTDIDAQTAGWLLAYNAARVGRDPAFPAVHLVGDSGVTATVGAGDPVDVVGPDNVLLGWLVGRLPPAGLDIWLPPLPSRHGKALIPAAVE